MWEKIKNDSLIKTIVVILLGVLAFGFAFHIMFGSGGSSMEEGTMMGSGYSLTNTLDNTIQLLTKLAVIALLAGVIVWIFRTIIKPSETGQNSRFTWLKDDSFIKYTLVVCGAVLVLLIGFSFVASNTMVITSLAFLLKVMILIFIVALGVALTMYFKENYMAVSKNNNTKQAELLNCPDCNAKVEKGWKCCPYCGSDKVSN